MTTGEKQRYVTNGNGVILFWDERFARFNGWYECDAKGNKIVSYRPKKTGKARNDDESESVDSPNKDGTA